MEKEFIPYSESLALKELGFDEPCFGSYVKLTETQNTFFMNDVVSEIDRETPLHKSLITKAPLYQQAFRFFREKYNLFCEIQIDRTTAPKFCFNIFQYEHFGNYEEIRIGEWYLYRTHEEAELECLTKLIEIVKSK